MVRQQTMGGEGRGFSRFPPLAVGQGESQQPTDSSRSIHEVGPLELRRGGEKERPVANRPFSFLAGNLATI